MGSEMCIRDSLYSLFVNMSELGINVGSQINDTLSVLSGVAVAQYQSAIRRNAVRLTYAIADHPVGDAVDILAAWMDRHGGGASRQHAGGAGAAAAKDKGRVGGPGVVLGPDRSVQGTSPVQSPGWRGRRRLRRVRGRDGG